MTLYECIAKTITLIGNDYCAVGIEPVGCYSNDMILIATFLNLPWTLIGLILAIISLPRRVTLKKPGAIVVEVKGFWWQSWLKGRKGVRAMSIGSVVILGGYLLKNDLEHELVHIEQSIREPLIHPLLYAYQSLRYGYRRNKYEIEAYQKAGNKYVE